MFLVRIVGVTEVVKDRDGLDDPVHCLRSKGGHTGRDDGNASGKVLPQLIIEGANLLCLEDMVQLRFVDGER